MIPLSISDDLAESVMYAYFAIRYFDDQIFRVISSRTNKFKGKFEYHQLLG